MIPKLPLCPMGGGCSSKSRDAAEGRSLGQSARNREKIREDPHMREEQTEVIFTEHLLCAKCHVKGFTLNLKNHSCMEIVISFSILQMRKLKLREVK